MELAQSMVVEEEQEEEEDHVNQKEGNKNE